MIPADVRFQVALPFTLDAVAPFFPEPADLPIVARAYETGIQRTIAAILEHVPAADLAIQFDYCAELIAMAGAIDELVEQGAGASPEALFARCTSPAFSPAIGRTAG